MRLISKQRDYYDGVAKGQWSDKSRTFVRKSEEIKDRTVLKSLKFPRFNDLEDNKYDYYLAPGIVGFCGKIYPFIHVHRINRNKTIDNTTDKYYYSCDELEKAIPFDKMRCISYGWRSRNSFTDNKFMTRLKLWLQDGRTSSAFYDSDSDFVQSRALKDFFIDKRVAYFYITHDRIVNRYKGKIIFEAYPVLETLEFYKVFDSFACFTKLEFYLVNELVKPDDPPIDPVPDPIKAESHGFNKFSFRKDPGKKKRKQKK